MDSRYRTTIGWAAAAAWTLLATGCNWDSSERVPEMNQARAETAPAQTPRGAPDQVPAPEVTASARIPESAADSALSSRVETALKAEPDLHGTSFTVRSDQGVVTLSGSAKDPQLRSMAAEVALSIDGVKLVRNEITLAQAT